MVIAFTDLEVWKVGITLLKEVYAITKKLPKEEMFGLTSQLRRSTASILANIAEGCGRYTYADKANKFTIARGECYETKAFLCMITELNLVSRKDIASALEIVDKEMKLLSGLITVSRQRAH